jgi:hypothetical protein
VGRRGRGGGRDGEENIRAPPTQHTCGDPKPRNAVWDGMLVLHRCPRTDTAPMRYALVMLNSRRFMTPMDRS